MNTIEELTKDIFGKIKESMRSKDSVRLSIYREIKSSITQFEKEHKGDKIKLPEFHKVIRKILKQHEESCKFLIDGKRLENQIEEEKNKIKILNNYLPQFISKEEMENVIDDVIGSKIGDNVNEKMIIGISKKQIESMGFSVDMKDLICSIKNKFS